MREWNENAPAEVADAISVGVKKIAGGFYAGVLKVNARCGRYVRRVGPAGCGRLNREDALADAVSIRQSWIDVNQLPE